MPGRDYVDEGSTMTDHIRIPHSGDLPVSSGIIQALATLTNTPPIEMPPLYESIDPSVLDAVFDQGSGECLGFIYDEALIQIRRTEDCDLRLSIDDGEQESCS